MPELVAFESDDMSYVHTGPQQSQQVRDLAHSLITTEERDIINRCIQGWEGKTLEAISAFIMIASVTEMVIEFSHGKFTFCETCRKFGNEATGHVCNVVGIMWMSSGEMMRIVVSPEYRNMGLVKAVSQ